MDIARYPASIYSYGMRFFVSFLIPVTVTATVPAVVLMEGYSPIQLVWTIIPIVVFLLIALALWNSAMKRYSSAGG